MRCLSGALVLPLAMIVTSAACTSTPHAGRIESTPPNSVSALAVDSALRVMARSPLWPGFDPLATPVAIFDGTRTYLFRHPSPPAGYAAVSGRDDVVARDGRDSAITANTSAMLGDVATGTVMLDPRSTVADAAALTLHELFHVFQRARHPDWQANEADLFTYPVEDSAALASRREETVALSRALGAASDDSLRCWTRAALQARTRRFALLGAAAAAYERGTELNEGLARYVEQRAAGRRITLEPADFPAAQVRPRAYAVGAALAAVLDRGRPGWRGELERSTDTTRRALDVRLADVVSGGTLAWCAPSDGERVASAVGAGEDVRALLAERTRVRAEYLGRRGWRVVIDAETSPFFPAGFDPLNVVRLSPTEILHTRFLKLQGGTGAVEVLGGSVLTEGAAGAHPLFNGVRRLTVAGLSAAPSMSDSAGVTMIAAPGLSARLLRVRVDVSSDTVRVSPR